MINRRQFLTIGSSISIFFIFLLSGCSQITGHITHKQAISKACRGTAVFPSLRCASAPSANFDNKGVLWVVWYYAGHIYVSRSADKGQTFGFQ